MKHGKYTKHFNVSDNSVVLSFDDNRNDNYYHVGKILNKNCYQVIEENEMDLLPNGRIKNVNVYYNDLLLCFYSASGKILNSLLVHFDFDNSTFSIQKGDNTRKFNVLDDLDYTYKFLKTKVRCIDGINGLYSYVVEAMNSDSVFNCSTFSLFDKLVSET